MAEAGAPSARVTAAYSGLIPTSAAIAIRAAEINRVITSSVVLFLTRHNHKENDKPGQSAAKKRIRATHQRCQLMALNCPIDRSMAPSADEREAN